MHRLQTLLFSKKEYFLMWNIAFLPIWFPSISPSNTSLRKTLPFCRSDLILVIKLEMRKPPFKRNPYLREKFGLTGRIFLLNRGFTVFALFGFALSNQLPNLYPKLRQTCQKWEFLCPRCCWVKYLEIKLVKMQYYLLKRSSFLPNNKVCSLCMDFWPKNSRKSQKMVKKRVEIQYFLENALS